MSAARNLSKAKTPAPSNSSANETTASGGYDPFKQSTLFHEVYLNVEVPLKFKDLWEPRDPKEFDNFCNSFRNLCAEYDFKDFDSWSENDTIQNWIIPVLHMLGYYDKCEGTAKPFSLDTSFTIDKKTLRPDFIIVDRPSDLKYIKDSGKSAAQKLDEARKYVKLTIEAKYWDRLEEYKQDKAEDKKRADNKKPIASEIKDPVEQTLEYMKMLHNDWGILTDGKVWRLYHRELSNDSQKRSFQFNLGYLAKFAQAALSSDVEEQKIFLANAKYFFFLFNKNALFGRAGKGKLLDHLIEYSKEYVHKIEDDLRIRFVQAMTTFCNGLHESMGNPKSEEKLNLIRNVAESHLFNIMFIKSCESRLILPMKGDYVAKSLTRMVQCLKRYKPERQFDEHNLEMLQVAFGNQSDENAFNFAWEGTELYERIIDLTEFVQKGTNAKFKNFKIEGFTETVFADEEWATAKKYKVSNKHIVAALFEIGYAKPDQKVNKYQQIPYNFFTARQLGSIYESFLEFKIDIAKEDMAFLKKQWKPAKLNSDKIRPLDVPKAKKDHLFFSPDNAERKLTGSYYTPDDLVLYMIDSTLSKVVESSSATEILKLKVCDPAMGSGHFLSGCLRYLTSKYLKKIAEETNDDVSFESLKIKQKILHNCIYGIDINPRAVKLAKLSLWMETASANSTLENLDDQLKTSDSLLSEFSNVFNGVKMDAIAGNPPYVATYSRFSEKENLKQMAQYEKMYTSMSGRKNTFLMFIEKISKLAIAQSNLRWSLIVPKTVLTMDAYLEIRRLIFSNRQIESISEFGYDVFDDATVPVCVITGSGKVAKSIVVNKQDAAGLPHRTLVELSYEEIATDPQLKVNSQMVGTAKKIVEKVADKKLSTNNLLGDFEVADGINPGPFREELTSASKTPGFVEMIEKAKYVTAYKISIPEKAYFDARVEAVAKLYKKFPEKENSRAVLGDLKRFSETKIVYRQTAPFHIAAIDDTGLLHYNSCHSIIGKNVNSTRLLLAWLNSSLCRFVFSKMFKEKEGVFPQIKVKHTRNMYVPIFTEIKDCERLIALTRQAEKVANPSKAIEEIDEIFFSFYKISSIEKQEISNTISTTLNSDERAEPRKRAS